jgi:hypothetical protein
MRDQDHEIVNLFGGAYVPEGYRGRTSDPVSTNPRRWALAAFCAVLFFTTAATAITLRHNSARSQSAFVNHSLPGNFVTRPFANGFEDALY